MNKRQKEVQLSFISDEEKVLRKLKNQYSHARKEIEKKIESLLARSDADTQHVIYQVEYQKALKSQISGILDTMQAEEFTTISEYLTKCYEGGFIGTMYDLQGQGIPLCFPLDQQAMVRAIQLDSKISKGLYTRLGEDVTVLKKKISSQISRGISTGKSYQEMAQQLSRVSKIGYNNAVRITATEGHRIQVQSAMDACNKAKESGADVVKQWDSTLDGRTRASHRKVDGELRELDQPFSNGLMFPGDPDGDASEVVRCRCALLQRAKWALDEEELEELKQRAEFFGLDKTENFEDYKKKYLKAVENSGEAEILGVKTLDNSGGSGIIGLRGNGSIYHEVTDKCIENVPKLEVFETDNLNVLHRKAIRELLREVAKVEPIGTEVSIVYDADMQLIEGFGYRIGKVGTVGVDNPGVPFHALHNHGSGETFSITDLNQFARNENMLSLSAVGNTGSMYNISRTINSDSDGYRAFLLNKSKEVFYSAYGVDFSFEAMNAPDQIGRVTEAISKLNASQIGELKSAIVKQSEACAKGGADYGFQYKFSKT